MCHSNCKSGLRSNIALLLLRVVVGGIFIFHGIMKIQNMQDTTIEGNLIKGTISGFQELGFPSWMAYFVSYAEVITGALLVLGVFTLYSAIILGCVMIVAAFKVKFGFKGVPFINRYVMAELDISLLASCIALALMGGGSWSVSRWCPCKCHKTGNGNCGICKAMGCVKGECGSSTLDSSNPVSSGM